VITPACGYVAATGAVVIGIAAGILPFFACTKLKSWQSQAKNSRRNSLAGFLPVSVRSFF
jgi:hypothetical protein